MPAFVNSMGQRVTADEATFDGTRLRAGYQDVLEEGERVGFDLAFMDTAASRSTVYLTDASPLTEDARAQQLEAYERSVAALNDWRSRPQAPAPLAKR